MANFITTLRIIFGILSSFLIVSSHESFALFFFLIGSLSDWLDGSIAKYSDDITEFGKIYDPFADKVLVLTNLSALLWTHQVNPYLMILILFREMFVSFLRTLAVKKEKNTSAILTGKVKAFFEMSGIILVLIGYISFGNMLLWVSLLFGYISMFFYFKNWL